VTLQLCDLQLWTGVPAIILTRPRQCNMPPGDYHAMRAKINRDRERVSVYKYPVGNGNGSRSDKDYLPCSKYLCILRAYRVFLLIIAFSFKPRHIPQASTYPCPSLGQFKL
jgi:hypothetical protein